MRTGAQGTWGKGTRTSSCLAIAKPRPPLPPGLRVGAPRPEHPSPTQDFGSKTAFSRPFGTAEGPDFFAQAALGPRDPSPEHDAQRLINALRFTPFGTLSISVTRPSPVNVPLVSRLFDFTSSLPL